LYQARDTIAVLLWSRLTPIGGARQPNPYWAAWIVGRSAVLAETDDFRRASSAKIQAMHKVRPMMAEIRRRCTMNGV
jgi:hypothetical protein